MRPGQNKRMRGRNNRRGPNPLTRSYESNGPDVKVRGTPQHIAEKYTQLARDAHVSGDPVAAESYLQHAEHYYRIIAAAHQAQQAQMGGAPADDRDDEDEDFDPTSDRFTFRPPQSMVAAQGGQPPYSGERSGEFAGEAGEGGEEGGAQPSGERPQGPRPPFNDRNRDRNRDRNFRPRNEGDRFGGERFGARPPRPVESEQPDVGGELPAFLTNPGRPAPIEGEGGEGEGEGDGQRLGFRNRRRRRRGPREGGEGGGFENEPSNAETDPV